MHKYLNREQTYAQLKVAVSELETRCERLKRDTQAKKDFIAKLKIEHKALVTSSSTHINAKSADATEAEILSLTSEIEYLEKELSTLTDRRKKFHLVSDQVGGWANRVVSKLNTQLLMNEEGAGGSSKNSLTSLFDQITNIVCDSLGDIVRHQAPHETEDVSMAIAKDFLKDLENEEFFAKNFRVRPVSGVGTTAGGGDDRQSEHYSRNNLGGEPANGGENDEDKVNKMMYMEMEE